MTRTIYLASDHAGYTHKNEVSDWLRSVGYAVEDCGAFVHNPEDDFTDYISIAATEVAAAPTIRRGIIFGGSGQGEAILANRFMGVRAAVYYGGPLDIVRLSREHNDANVLSIGARFVSPEEAIAAVEQWLNTKALTNPKYRRRNQKIAMITRKISNFLATEM